MRAKTIAKLAGLAVSASLLLAPAAHAAYGDAFGIAPALGPAQPGPTSFWAGTCSLATAPAIGDPIGGDGVGTRNPTMLTLENPSIYINPSNPASAEQSLSPATPANCIDHGAPVQGWPAWADEPAGGPVEGAPQWRLAAETAAGSHPDGSASFSFDREPDHAETAGSPDNIYVDLPPGVAGDPGAVPKCSGEQFDMNPVQCPPASQVGITEIALKYEVAGISSRIYPIYNLEPRKGKTAEFGIPDISNFTTVRVLAKARTNGDFGVTTFAPQIPAALDLFAQTVTLWGVPWAASHDRWRLPQGAEIVGSGNEGIPHSGLAPADQAPYEPSWGPIRPFVSNPTSCSGPLSTRFATDAYQHPGSFTADGDPNLADPNWKQATSAAPAVTDCEDVSFNPTISLDPTTKQSDSPTGLDVELAIPQNNEPPAGIANDPSETTGAPAYWRTPAGRATSHLRDTTVTLPQGMTLNPAAAEGLDACTSSQIGLTSAIGATPLTFNNQPVRCPEAAKVGTVKVETPLLEEADWPTGDVYLASQFDNPFASRFALYITLRSPERNLIAKLAGKVTADPVTGQLTTTVTENPQLPFDKFTLHFKGGPRGALATPPTCSTEPIHTTLSPYSDPTNPVVFNQPLAIDQGPGASACAPTKAARPFNLGFSAGSASPIAGAHSAFTLRLTRPDGAQEISGLSVKIPSGFTAVLKGVPYCPDAALAAAASRPGKAEQASPSCPAASQIGTTTVGAGAGSPTYVGGRFYLTGPYKGAPLSFAAVVPAVSGPFDLGTVVVRTALQIDPKTAQITAVADPLPQILEGVPLRVRDIRVDVDRPSFGLNPTNCSAMAVSASVQGASGATANVSNRFQLDGCQNLAFKPKLQIQLFGGTKRGDYQRLRATVQGRPGDANIARAAVTLPHSEFLAQEHIRTICTRVQFAAKICPAGSVYGQATAITPLLDSPLSGPVYLRSSDNPLPDLVAALRGPDTQPIEVELSGRTDSKNAGIRNTFDLLPDAPVSKFTLELKGGRKSLIVNSRDICKSKNLATIRLGAQNGRTRDFRTAVLNPKCKQARKGGGKKR
jgi:hypothetical protein